MLSSRLHFPVQLTSKLVYKFLILLYFRCDLYFGICLGLVVLYTLFSLIYWEQPNRSFSLHSSSPMCGRQA